MSDQNLAQVISGAIPGSANERRYLHTRLSKLASDAEHGGAAGNEALALATALCEVLGIYSNALTLSPQAAQTGKKITVDGEVVDAEGLVITAPLEVQQGIVYTIPASGSYADGTAIVAKVVTEEGQTTYVPLMWPITADPLTGKYSFLATETTNVVFTMFESNVGGSISGVYSDIFFQIASALMSLDPSTNPALAEALARKTDKVADSENKLAAFDGNGNLKSSGFNLYKLFNKDNIVGETGNNEDKIIHQKKVTELLSGKQDTAPGKGLSTEDFTTALKEKLADLPNSQQLAQLIASAISDALTGYVSKTGEELLVIAAALADVFADVKNLAARNQFGSIKIVDANLENVPRVNGFPMVVYGAGAPSATTLPRQSGLPAFIGQHYIDTSNAKEYSSKGTENTSDWFLLN